MVASTQNTEKRFEKRWHVNKPGYFFRAGSNIPEACRILDWSARGAKVGISKNVDAPDEFILSIEFGENIYGSAHCRKVWTAKSMIGVQFKEELFFEFDTDRKRSCLARDPVWKHLLKQKQEMANTEAFDSDGNSKPRQYARLRTLKSGQLLYAGGIGSWDCSIRDLTPLGARLRFSEPYDGPNRIVLRIGLGELKSGEVPGMVAWRRGNEVGVSFDQEIPL
ncbi:MAG: hypothetical protein EP340_06615 [Alphaproteobacteria bacterium]|nr:MAG: hypothetical protein EP340_06615 [Alphaproteobacteria bacterium]